MFEIKKQENQKDLLSLVLKINEVPFWRLITSTELKFDHFVKVFLLLFTLLLQVCGRTIRVDHVHEYKVPKKDEPEENNSEKKEEREEEKKWGKRQ